jgi:hypothetical protein
MARRQINFETVVARLPAGRIARIERTLGETETQAEFLREAIDRELRRRERAGVRAPQSKSHRR